MHRESVFVCSYADEQGEHAAYVRAWDAREAAELFVREMGLESGRGEIPIDEVRVVPVLSRSSVAA